MAARKKATRKKATAKRKTATPKVQETPEQVIRALLKSRLDLKGTWESRLRKALETTKVKNPLENPPAFIVKGRRDWGKEGKIAVERNSVEERDEIFLGLVDGFEAMFYKADHGMVIMEFGCQEKESEADARAHWPNNKSVHSYKERPHVTAMIDYCAALAKHLKWDW
jgi:hypothetical protein